MNAKRSVLINSSVTTRNGFPLQSSGSTIRKGKNFSRGRWMVIGMAFAVGGGVALAGVRLATSKLEIPTAQVKRGEFVDYVQLHGEIKAFKSLMIAAPTAAGDLQIIKLAPNGTQVERGDIVAQFDTSKLGEDLARERSALKQAEAEIEQVRTEAHLKEEQEQTALARARYELEAAKLEASAQENIDNMRIRSPIAGLVEVRQNRGASGGFFLPGMSLPEYREGDRLSPGSPIAQVLETDQIEIHAKVTETDRANLERGQPVDLHVDALPGETFGGKVKTVAGAAVGDFEAWNTMRKFDIAIQLDRCDVRLRPGFTAQLVILGRQVKDVLYLPRQAVFEKNTRPIVYVKRGGRFEAHEIKIKYRNETRVSIEGLEEGVEVALVNPESQGKKPNKTSLPLVGKVEIKTGNSPLPVAGFQFLVSKPSTAPGLLQQNFVKHRRYGRS